MARGKGQGDSVQGWFREYFRGHPEALDTRSNAEVIEAWKNDHIGQDFGDKEKNAMSNVKSNERTRLKQEKRDARKKDRGDMGGEAAAPKAPRASRPSGNGLEALEVAIDRSLSVARGLEESDEEMGDVVRWLRQARNRVVWIQGK